MKTENRVNHAWGEEDEWGIAECKICHSLMKKKALSTFSLRSRTKNNNAWENLYSLRGTKWHKEHIPCK